MLSVTTAADGELQPSAKNWQLGEIYPMAAALSGMQTMARTEWPGDE